MMALHGWKGGTGTAPLILNFSNICRWVVNFTSRPLYPWGEKGTYLIRSSVGLRLCWDGFRRRDLLPLPRSEYGTNQDVASRYTD
jgi:hypothetical protein